MSQVYPYQGTNKAFDQNNDALSLDGLSSSAAGVGF